MKIEKYYGEKFFIISHEKSLQKIKMRIDFITNFKYYNWIEMFSYVLDRFSLFKFEFLTPLMINQILDNKALYDLLKSFLLIQIQGDIPIRKVLEFLKVEKIITQLASKLIPDKYGIFISAFTSITFTLNTSIEEIPFEIFKLADENYVLSFDKTIEAFLGIPNAFLDCEDVEINFHLLRNNLKILLTLPVKHSIIIKEERIKKHSNIIKEEQKKIAPSLSSKAKKKLKKIEKVYI